MNAINISNYEKWNLGGKHKWFTKEIAKKLGVKPDFTTVTSANRLQYLEQGKIDMLLATLSDTAKWLLTVGMLLGRLEILTVLVLFTRAFWKH